MDNVFIDTSIFIENNYLEGGAIQELFRLSSSNEINIILTQIVVEEINNNFSNDLQIALDKASSLKVLKNLSAMRDNLYRISSDNDYFDNNKAEWLEKITTAFNKANVQVVEYGTTDIQPVFEKYFSKAPPFGKGKKKKEFPDAFSLHLLEEWCKKNDAKCLVLTTDTDILSYESQYLSIEGNYKDYLDRKLKAIEKRQKKDLIEKSLKLFEEEKGKLESSIREIIHDELYNEDYYRRYSHLEIHEIDINTLEVEIIDNKVVSVLGNNVEIEGRVEIFIRITVVIDDEDFGIYDSEDKTMTYLETREDTIENRRVIPVTFYVVTPDAGESFREIQIGSINYDRYLLTAD